MPCPRIVIQVVEGYETGAYWVEVDVADKLKQIGLTIDQCRFEAILK